MSKKVTIEVTENGWETKVELNGKTYIEKYKRTSFGSEGYEGDFENEEDLTDELYYALDEFEPHNIMKALRNQKCR